MLKYIILYKNGKTWNGKAETIVDIPVVACLLLAAKQTDGYTYLYYSNGIRWCYFDEVYSGSESKSVKRTPNPKSTTKKQKAFDEAYLEWTMEHFAKYDNCPSVKEYKKWLWVQKNEKAVKVDKDGFIPWYGGEMPVPRGTMVHVKLRSGKEVICTAGYHPSSKQFKRLSDNWLYATDWSHDNEPGDIVAYRVYDEEPKPSDDKHINFPSGASISWKSSDDIFLSSYDIHELSKLKPGDYKIAFYTNKPPIKTTYTFWLGATGEIVDDK